MDHHDAAKSFSLPLKTAVLLVCKQPNHAVEFIAYAYDPYFHRPAAVFPRICGRAGQSAIRSEPIAGVSAVRCGAAEGKEDLQAHRGDREQARRTQAVPHQGAVETLRQRISTMRGTAAARRVNP